LIARSSVPAPTSALKTSAHSGNEPTASWTLGSRQSRTVARRYFTNSLLRSEPSRPLHESRTLRYAVTKSFITSVLASLALLRCPLVAPSMTIRQNPSAPSLPLLRHAQTDQEKAHANRWSMYDDLLSQPLTAPAQSPGAVAIIKGDPIGYGSGPSLLVRDVCRSSLVALGTVTSMVPYLSPGESVVYTDYNISVRTVIANRLTQSLTASVMTSPITITRLGGEGADMSGRHLRTIVDSRDISLRVGAAYVLILTRLANTNDYTPGHEYEVDGDTARNLSRNEAGGAPGAPLAFNALLKEINSATPDVCPPAAGLAQRGGR
jgi:hypothetical protein